LDEVLVSVEQTELLPQLEGAAASGSSPLQIPITRADGVRRLLEIAVWPRREEGGIVGNQGLVRDVTAAHDLDDAKNEFLALITHDLRNPLTAVLGLSATLETYASELPADRLQRMGASIRRQAERIARLADDLHDISRLEASSLVLNLRTVDLAATVDLALASVDDHTGVELRIPPELRVLADSRRLEQIIANLVENALVHGATPVLVEARPYVGEVEVTVRDHGPGVPESLVPTLFSRLRTFGRGDRDRGRGTGLGRALVRGLVEAMGGRVRYEPAADGGASFCLVLPSPPRRDRG